jgi:urease accessory protein
MKCKAKFFQMLALLVLVQPMMVDAHPLHWTFESIGFLSGLSHPITSSEHILTMLVVGLCISQTGRRSVCYMPFVFVALMLMGGGLTLMPIEIAHAENFMYLSVLILALMLAAGFKVTMPVGMLIVGNVAVFHGHVHAFDMLLEDGAIAYTAGFAVATLVLIGVGIVTRWLFDHLELKYSLSKLVER